jgi:hypothetical protein
MGVSRRTLLLVALGIALLGVVTAYAVRDTSTTTGERTPTEQAAGPAPEQEMAELQIGAAREQTVRGKVGEPLQLTIDGAGEPDVVAIDDLSQSTQISPELPAVFDLLPDRAGTYPITLQSSGERIGALRITG